MFLNSRKKLGIFIVGGFSLLAGLVLVLTAVVGKNDLRAGDLPVLSMDEPTIAPLATLPMSQITTAMLGTGTTVVDQTNTSSTFSLKAGHIYKFEVWGAQGGGSMEFIAAGGKGGYAMGYYDMRSRSAQTAAWFGGSAGGINSSGGGISNYTGAGASENWNGYAGGRLTLAYAGGGGGASGILVNGTVAIVAGGGGGGGYMSASGGEGEAGAQGGTGGGTLQRSGMGYAGMRCSCGNTSSIAGPGGGGGGGYGIRYSGDIRTSGPPSCVTMNPGTQYAVTVHGPVGDGGAGGGVGSNFLDGVVSISNSAKNTNGQRDGHGRVVITEYTVRTVANVAASGTGWSRATQTPASVVCGASTTFSITLDEGYIYTTSAQMLAVTSVLPTTARASVFAYRQGATITFVINNITANITSITVGAATLNSYTITGPPESGIGWTLIG